MKIAVYILVVTFTGAAVAFGFNLPSNSSEWASWVQGFGSIGAIISAVWVMNSQHERALKKAEDDLKGAERRFLVSIKTEVILLFEAFNETTKSRIAHLAKGEKLERFYEFPDDIFTVYDNLVAEIGCVMDDDLRRTIIEGYSKARGLLLLIRMNNSFLRQRDDLKRQGELGNARAAELVDENLCNMTDQIVDRYASVVECVERIKRMVP